MVMPVFSSSQRIAGCVLPSASRKVSRSETIRSTDRASVSIGLTRPLKATGIFPNSRIRMPSGGASGGPDVATAPEGAGAR